MTLHPDLIFTCERAIDSLTDFGEQAPRLLNVAHQSRASAVFYHFFCRTTHVDIDTIRSALARDFGRFGHDNRVGAENLYGERRFIPVGNQISSGAPVVIKQSVGADHFAGNQRALMFLNQKAKGYIGVAGHRRQYKRIVQCHVSYVHMLWY